MARGTCLLTVVLILLVAAPPPARAADYVPGEVIVQLRPGANINARAAALGLRVLDQSAFAPLYRLGLPLGAVVDRVVGLLRLSPLVVAAEPNYYSGALQAPPPPPPGGTPPGYNSASKSPSPPSYQLTSTFDGGKPPAAYGGQGGVAPVRYGAVSQRYDGAGVTVAILDTGISGRHAALASQVTRGWNFVRESGDTDDVPRGVDSDRNGQADQGAGHGTMVAGIVARFAPRA